MYDSSIFQYISVFHYLEEMRFRFWFPDHNTQSIETAISVLAAAGVALPDFVLTLL